MSAINNMYIDCGTSFNAVRAAVGAFVALGGINKLHETSFNCIEKRQKDGVAHSICMYSHGAISYSPTKWFDESNSWTKAGDLSALTYRGPYKPVEIKLTTQWLAIVGEKYTEVGCQTILNENVLKVAEAIEQINKTKGK